MTFSEATNMGSFDFSLLSGRDDMKGSDYFDKLYGGAGNDIVEGRLGKDTLTGGSGADKFVFKKSIDSWSILDTKWLDTITDFSRKQRDKIGLNYMDADTTRAGNNAFTFVGSKGFSGKAGELAAQNTKKGLYIGGDTDGDGIKDFMVFLKGVHSITKSDFYL
jgi:Ca2+-binding RTX toxin-like protein